MASKQAGWRIYKEQMGLLDHGDALWEPAPIYSYKRVKLGDVGYIRRGRFHLLFSAGCPLGARRLGIDVPHTFEPLDIGNVIFSQPRLPGYLCTSTVKESGGGGGVSVSTAPFLEPGASFAFELTEKQGAALVTKCRTYREDAELEFAFEEYTKRYYNSWVAFARRARHGGDVKPVLVTGIDMTRDFAMIAYSNTGTHLSCEFNASVPLIGSANASVWGTWNVRGLVHTNSGPQLCSPPSPNAQDQDPSDANQVSVIPNEYNQCVFIRYYTMRRRAFLFPKVIKAGAGPHDLGSGNNHNETLPELTVQSGTDSDTVPGGSEDFKTDCSNSVTNYEPGLELFRNVSSEEEDSFDIVGRYIFENSEAEAALIHHRDIAKLREGIPETEVSEIFLEHRPVVVVDNGIVGRLTHKSHQQAAVTLPGTTNPSPTVTACRGLSNSLPDQPSANLQQTSLHDSPLSSPPRITTSSAPTSSQAASWQTLLTLDRKSGDFTYLARQLLNDQRHRKFEVSQFSEDEALNLVDLIEPTILQLANIPGDLKNTAFTMLRGLCGTFGKLPKSFLINEDFKTQETPLAARGYTDLWKRDWNGIKVGVKALRFTPDDDRSKTIKRFCKEVLLWKRLTHPNILTFHGVSMNQNQFCMVCSWMENGNILSYTKENPEANRLRLLIDVASGLKFLHQMDLVHGNIRGSNTLISDDRPPRALLGDFGLNTIVFDPFFLTRASVNWTAPELLTFDNTLYRPSVPSDIYAFAMTIYEVLTGTPPFARRGKAELARKVVLGDERPPRPMDSEKLGFTDEVWKSLRGCWEKEPSARPSIDTVSDFLEQAAATWVTDVPTFILASEMMNMKEGQAKDFADRLAKTLDQIGIGQSSGKTYLKHLQRLCEAFGVLPASFTLTDGFDHIEARPFTSGGFADVYKGTYKGQPVVAKALKTTSVDDLENVHKRFAKEVVGWKWLRHENILPFVGVTSIPPPFSMVSAWMENGNIMSFIRATPDQNPFSLLVDVANGLQYLHQHDFVHGDLKGANILINSERRACLADFGLTTIIEDADSDGPSSHKGGGTTRWMAPEILDPDRYGYVKRARRKLPSKSTDMYALGMTILEVVTGRRPFEHTNPDAAVIQKVLSGGRPDRPTVGFSDALWALLIQTWLEEFESSDSPSVRPNIRDILERLLLEAKIWIPVDRLLFSMEQTASSASSIESSRFPKSLVGHTGDDFETYGSPTVDFDNILKDIDALIGNERVDSLPDGRDIPTQDVQPSPILSPIIRPREETKQSLSQSRAPLRLVPPILQGPPAYQRTEKGGVTNEWKKTRRTFTRTFGGGNRVPPKLSDKLVLERDDEVKWY